MEATAVWPQGLLDAYIAMNPKVDGDSAPSGSEAPLCVTGCLSSVGVLQAHSTQGLGTVLGPSLFFFLGNGVLSVEAWFSTALDIEEVSYLVRGMISCIGHLSSEALWVQVFPLFVHGCRWFSSGAECLLAPHQTISMPGGRRDSRQSTSACFVSLGSTSSNCCEEKG